MDQNSINSFLEKFKQILGSEAGIRDTIIRIVEERLGIKIDSKDVTIKNGVLEIKGPAYLKNEIYMQREEILEDLKNKIGMGKIHKIK